jgi:hypothetical protein
MIDFSFLKSRTVWMAVILFIVNGITGIRENIPAGWLPLIDAILTMLTIYFRVEVKQPLAGFKKKPSTE